MKTKNFEIYFSDHDMLKQWINSKLKDGWKLKNGGLKYWSVGQYPMKGEVELMGGMILLHSGSEIKFASVKMINQNKHYENSKQILD